MGYPSCIMHHYHHQTARSLDGVIDKCDLGLRGQGIINKKHPSSEMMRVADGTVDRSRSWVKSPSDPRTPYFVRSSGWPTPPAPLSRRTPCEFPPAWCVRPMPGSFPCHVYARGVCEKLKKMFFFYRKSTPPRLGDCVHNRHVLFSKKAAFGPCGHNCTCIELLIMLPCSRSRKANSQENLLTFQGAEGPEGASGWLTHTCSKISSHIK